MQTVFLLVGLSRQGNGKALFEAQANAFDLAEVFKWISIKHKKAGFISFPEMSDFASRENHFWRSLAPDLQHFQSAEYTESLQIKHIIDRGIAITVRAKGKMNLMLPQESQVAHAYSIGT